jgi:putative redox protein
MGRQGSATITWLHDHTFIGTDSTNHSVVISSPTDGVGMRPSELLLVAIASCSAVDIVSILGKRRATVTGLAVQISGEQADEEPWPWHKIHIHYRVTGPDVQEKDVARAVELSEGKYCSVSATVKPTATITTSYEVLQPGYSSDS